MWENIQFKKDYKLRSERESLYVSFQEKKKKKTEALSTSLYGK